MPNITVGELKRHGTASSVAGTDTVMIIQGNALKETTVTSLVDAASTQTDQTITTLSTTTIQGVSDSNTTIVFGDDSIVGSAGGVEFYRMVESTQDALTINNGAVDLDVTIKKLTSGNLLNYDSGTDVLTLGTKPAITIDDASNNAVTDVLALTHTTSGSPAAGIGAGIQFNIEDAGGSEEQARIDAVARVVTDSSEDVDLNFKTNVNGTITQMMAIVADETGSGGAKLVQIGTDANQVSLDIHPSTTAKGTLRITAADSAGDTVTTITNASQAAARTYTIPDAGGAANFVLTTSVGSVTGARCSTQFDAVSGTTGTTLTDVVGMSVNLIAGATYTVDVYIGGTSTTNSGLKLALGGNATWTSTDATAAYYTASAVAVGHNATATPGTAIGGSTAANIYATVKATIVVANAGTLTLMAAQNASHTDTTSVYVNSYINATRIA